MGFAGDLPELVDLGDLHVHGSLVRAAQGVGACLGGLHHQLGPGLLIFGVGGLVFLVGHGVHLLVGVGGKGSGPGVDLVDDGRNHVHGLDGDGHGIAAVVILDGFAHGVGGSLVDRLKEADQPVGLLVGDLHQIEVGGEVVRLAGGHGGEGCVHILGGGVGQLEVFVVVDVVVEGVQIVLHQELGGVRVQLAGKAAEGVLHQLLVHAAADGAQQQAQAQGQQPQSFHQFHGKSPFHFPKLTPCVCLNSTMFVREKQPRGAFQNFFLAFFGIVL